MLALNSMDVANNPHDCRANALYWIGSWTCLTFDLPEHCVTKLNTDQQPGHSEGGLLVKSSSTGVFSGGLLRSAACLCRLHVCVKQISWPQMQALCVPAPSRCCIMDVQADGLRCSHSKLLMSPSAQPSKEVKLILSYSLKLLGGWYLQGCTQLCFLSGRENETHLV